MDLLLGYLVKMKIFLVGESVISELGQYIANTGRLFSRVADRNAPQYNVDVDCIETLNLLILNYIRVNFTFETLNLHCERFYTREDCASRPDTEY